MSLELIGYSGNPKLETSKEGRGLLFPEHTDLLGWKSLLEKTNPVPVHNRFNVCFLVSAFSQQSRDLLQVRDCVQIMRGLLGAEATVEVASNGRVTSVAGKLANVVDMVDNGFQAHRGAGRFSSNPARIEHPGIEGGANDRVALDQGTDLVICKLTISRHERPAVMVAGQHPAFEKFHCLPEALISQMSHVQNHAGLLHSLDQPR